MILLESVRTWARMVKFSHSVFALPFALSGAALAALEFGISPARVFWIVVAMVAARNAAMSFNRLVDQRIDSANPRTANRELPSGRLAIIGVYEANGNPTMARPGFVEFRGSQGTLYIHDSKLKVVPERGGQFQDSKPRMKPIEVLRSEVNHTTAHARNFLDCIKSRKRPNADVEIGHRSTTFSLLANISLVTRSRLEWDAEKEVITNNKQANDLLHYEYRKPWKLG